jgi:hypothetical protein
VEETASAVRWWMGDDGTADGIVSLRVNSMIRWTMTVESKNRFIRRDTQPINSP